MQDPKLSVRMVLACATALARLDGQEVNEKSLADYFAKRLADDATPDRVFSEHGSRDRNDHDQERSEREHGVIRERRALGHRVVGEPFRDRLDGDLPPFPEPLSHGAISRKGCAAGGVNRGAPVANARGHRGRFFRRKEKPFPRCYDR